MQFVVYSFIAGTRYIWRVVFGIISLEENLMADVWTRQITSLSAQNNLILYKLMLGILMFLFYY